MNNWYSHSIDFDPLYYFKWCHHNVLNLNRTQYYPVGIRTMDIFVTNLTIYGKRAYYDVRLALL
jgi:hypothetical protein